MFTDSTKFGSLQLTGLHVSAKLIGPTPVYRNEYIPSTLMYTDVPIKMLIPFYRAIGSLGLILILVSLLRATYYK